MRHPSILGGCHFEPRRSLIGGSAAVLQSAVAEFLFQGHQKHPRAIGEPERLFNGSTVTC